MDPLTAALITGLLSGAGGFFGGLSQAKEAGAARKETARQFDVERADRKAREAWLNRVIQTRLGLPFQEFRPHDIFNPSYGSGPTQFGGYDREEFYRRLYGSP